jgi:endoglucanase
MIYRKFTTILLVLALILTLLVTACNDGDSTQSQQSQSVNSANTDNTPTASNTPSFAEQHEETRRDLPEEIPAPAYNPSEHEMRDISAHELIAEIQTGWNLGNTFDAPTEIRWGNPYTTFTMINAVAQAGFDAVRIPVSWAEHMGGAPDFIIEDYWLDRVQEVADYVLALDMYCILNTHHEEDWLYPTAEREQESTVQLVALWEQLCERFADYNEKLIFEAMNEPRLKGTSDEWNGGTFAAQSIVNNFNQAFVDTVRASGGRNEIRHLMVPSYAASAEDIALNMLSLGFPKNDDKIIASVHAYVPYDFALSQTRGIDNWSIEKGGQEVDWLFGRLKERFIDKDIPIILGETGAVNRDGNLQARVAWTQYYFGKARDMGIPCFWWDNGLTDSDCENFGLLNRRYADFEFPEIIDAIMGN